MPEAAIARDTEAHDIDMLLNGIRYRSGYDFTHYSRASLKRRINRARDFAHVNSYKALLERLFQDENYFGKFLEILSITVTEPFRDPAFYRGVREKVIPHLKTFPFVKIWHAGCSTGEEVYSMAILLHEEGMLQRSRIYATDFNHQALAVGLGGVYPEKNIQNYTDNYRACGGRGKFSDYYNASYGLIKFKEYLKDRITFSHHNLVTDGIFGEMNVICCRNVLIYFDRVLQNCVLQKLADSLRQGGFLCLGNKENLNFTSVAPLFKAMDSRQRIYKKFAEVVAVKGGGHAPSLNR